MNISAEEKYRYLREAEVVLAREGFLTDRTHAGSLRILLDGAPLCEVPESGDVTYRMADVSTPERIAAKDKVYSIVRAVAEYMYQMERAPILKVDGLEDSYKVLADFNSVVLAGCPSKYGTQFVTWDRDFDHKGVSHGHYYTGLYASGNYEAAKRDFATRSGLIPEPQVFRGEQLIEIYRCCADTMKTTPLCRISGKRPFKRYRSRSSSVCRTLRSVSGSRTRNQHRNKLCNVEWQGRSFW